MNDRTRVPVFRRISDEKRLQLAVDIIDAVGILNRFFKFFGTIILAVGAGVVFLAVSSEDLDVIIRTAVIGLGLCSLSIPMYYTGSILRAIANEWTELYLGVDTYEI